MSIRYSDHSIINNYQYFTNEEATSSSGTPLLRKISKNSLVTKITDLRLLPLDYKPFIMDYGKTLASKQCQIRNFKTKQAIYLSYNEQLTLPSNASSGDKASLLAATTDSDKAVIVRLATIDINHENHIKELTEELSQLKNSFQHDLEDFLDRAGIEEVLPSLEDFQQWLFLATQHWRCIFANNSLQNEAKKKPKKDKAKAISSGNAPMEIDITTAATAATAVIPPKAVIADVTKVVKDLLKTFFNDANHQKSLLKQFSNGKNGKGKKAQTNPKGNNPAPIKKGKGKLELKNSNKSSYRPSSLQEVQRSANKPGKKMTRFILVNPNKKSVIPILPSLLNSEFTNYTKVDLSKVSKVLGYGLKFIPPPSKDIDYASIEQYIEDAINKACWKYHFRELEYGNNITDTSYNPKLNSISITPYPKQHQITSCLPQISTIFRMRIQKIISNTPKIKFECHPSFIDLKNLSKTTPETIIRATDKNLGLVALDTLEYHKLIMDHLSDIKTYECLGLMSDNVDNIIDIINRNHRSMKRLVINPSRQELKLINDIGRDVPKFHVLPKIHKSPMKGRPIVGAVNWVATPFSRILDQRLQIHLSHEIHNSILKDSSDLISRWSKISFDPTKQFLVSFDVTSLYTNIDTAKAVDIIEPLDIKLAQLAFFIMNSNYFEYRGLLYKQLEGIAMGTNCAVSIANLYMSKIDYILRSYKGVTDYIRFIDDIGFIFTGSRQELDDLITFSQTICAGIQFTTVISKESLDILDLTFYPIDGKLEFKTFQKLMNKYLYLPFFTHHPKSTISGFVKGELNRYKRTNSSIDNMKALVQLFFSRLKLRGYPKAYLNNILYIFRNPNPKKILSRDNDSIYITLPYIRSPRVYAILKYIKSPDNILREIASDIIPVWTTTTSIAGIVLKSNLSTEQIKYINNELPSC